MLRRPDGLHLTPLGAQIAPLIEEVEQAVLAITGLAETRRTHVRLATPSGFAKLFSENLALLRRQNPEIALRSLEGHAPWT
jgi:DNA-binding transcriptional LysR family regulator